MRSMPTRETRTQASITMPLSRTRSGTSMRLVPLDARSRSPMVQRFPDSVMCAPSEMSDTQSSSLLNGLTLSAACRVDHDPHTSAAERTEADVLGIAINAGLAVDHHHSVGPAGSGLAPGRAGGRRPDESRGDRARRCTPFVLRRLQHVVH